MRLNFYVYECVSYRYTMSRFFYFYFLAHTYICEIIQINREKKLRMREEKIFYKITILTNFYSCWLFFVLACVSLKNYSNYSQPKFMTHAEILIWVVLLFLVFCMWWIIWFCLDYKAIFFSNLRLIQPVQLVELNSAS